MDRKPDRRVTHYFVALRSHARLRFLGDIRTVLLKRERKRENNRGLELCARKHARWWTQNGSVGTGSRWNLEMYRPSDFGVRCRIIISIIPDPNYDGINSRPESESTRKEGAGWALDGRKENERKRRIQKIRESESIERRTQTKKGAD